MTKEKQQGVEHLVQEELASQHIEESTSPWNSLVFVIKKKFGKWRILKDLRAVNKIIKPMVSLQPGSPLPSLLAKEWSIVVIDLKDCFFTIPLHKNDKEV